MDIYLFITTDYSGSPLTHTSLIIQAPYLLHMEVVECEDTYLSPLPTKQLDVGVQSARLGSRLAGVCVRSEGTSPSSMRAASLPCLAKTAASTRVSGVVTNLTCTVCASVYKHSSVLSYSSHAVECLLTVSVLVVGHMYITSFPLM